MRKIIIAVCAVLLCAMPTGPIMAKGHFDRHGRYHVDPKVALIVKQLRQSVITRTQAEQQLGQLLALGQISERDVREAARETDISVADVNNYARLYIAQNPDLVRQGQPSQQTVENYNYNGAPYVPTMSGGGGGGGGGGGICSVSPLRAC